MNNQKFKWVLAVSVTLLITVHSYIDIGLTAVTSSADLALNMPLTINSMQYHIAVSLHSQQDFIVSPSVLPHKKTLPTSKKPKEGEMHVWSLEGYNLEGWKRFFMEVFLFEDSKYSHTVSLDLSGIKVIDKKMPMTNGVISLGPSLTDNLFYQLIKNQTKEYFR